MKHVIAAVALMLLALSSFAQKVKKPIYLLDAVEVEKISEIKARFDHFKQQIIGHFSNKKQVAEHPELGDKEQEFIIIPMMKERVNEFWVYIEFFSPNMLDAPLDQRVEQYVRLNRDTIRMEVFYLKDPAKYANEWKKPNPFEGFTRDELVRDKTCDLFIVHNDEQPNTYQTVVPESIDCALKVANGASKYVLLQFGLSDKGYDMRFDFFDKDKKLMKQGHVLEFDRLDYRKEGYVNYAPGVKVPKAPKTPKPSKEPKKK